MMPPLSPSPTLPIFFFRATAVSTASGGAPRKVRQVASGVGKDLFSPSPSNNFVAAASMHCLEVKKTSVMNDISPCGFVTICCVAMHVHDHSQVWGHSLISAVNSITTSSMK